MLIAVDDSLGGLRIDVLVARGGAAKTVNAARRAIEEGRVRVDGRPARKGDRARVGQVVEVDDQEPLTLLADIGLSLMVLHEDADLVAVAKPGGIPSHPLRSGDGPTLAAALCARYPECADASEDAREGGLGHRLDLGTSGVLVAARSRSAWHALRAALGGSDCQKSYLAEVVGRPRPPLPGDPYAAAALDGKIVVTAPIGRTGRRGSRVRLDGGRQPLPARTEVRLLAPRLDTTLVEARLSRGRPHQVRVHLAYLGAPVVGDATYGEGTKTQEATPLRLHAATVTFRHPTTGEEIRIEAPAPGWARADR